MAVTPQKRRHKVYTIPELISLEDDPDRWIVPGVIPTTGRTIVFGDGGTYKTTIIMDLAIAVASGGLMLRQFPVHKFGPVLFVSTEGSILDNKDRVMAHLRAHEADPDKVKFFFCQEPFDMDDPLDVGELRTYIDEIKPMLVILDPLDSFIRGDENSAKETKELRRRVNELVHEFDLSLLIIHHENKEGKMRGSSAWHDWADVELQMTTQESTLAGIGQPVKIVTVKANKVRNGAAGKVFSVAPLHDKNRGIVDFIYYEGDGEAIVSANLRQRTYAALYYAPVALTTKDVATQLNTTSEKIGVALRDLERMGFADKGGTVTRSTSVDGSRTRTVPAWRVVQRTSPVDAAAAILKYQRQLIEEDLNTITIDPMAMG